jgi:hypothetical protein
MLYGGFKQPYAQATIPGLTVKGSLRPKGRGSSFMAKAFAKRKASVKCPPLALGSPAQAGSWVLDPLE